jgi:hypothetical protein
VPEVIDGFSAFQITDCFHLRGYSVKQQALRCASHVATVGVLKPPKHCAGGRGGLLAPIEAKILNLAGGARDHKACLAELPPIEVAPSVHCHDLLDGGRGL